MKKISSFRLGLVLFFAVLAAACGGGGDGDPLLGDTQPGQPTAPIARISIQATSIVGVVTQLDGRESGPGVISYRWAITDQPNSSDAQLTSTTSPNPTITPDVAGIYRVSLVVNDGTQDSTPATASFTADPPSDANTPPVADAGPDRTVGLGTPVALNAAQSMDADGDPLTFSWEFISTPGASAVETLEASTVLASFTPDYPGDYIIRLTVNDGQATNTTEVTIKAIPAFFRTYGGEGFEEARSIAVLPDGYLIAGESNSAGIAISNDGWDLTVFRTDLAGRVVDTLVFDNDEVDETWAMDVDLTDPSDIHIALAGYTQSFEGEDAFMMEAPLATSTTTFEPLFPGDGFDMAQAVRYTSDGGLLACGFSTSNPPFDVEETGSAIFATKIGTNAFLEGFSEVGYVDCWAVEETAQGYFLAGVNDREDFDHGEAYLLKIDKSTGGFLWEGFFGAAGTFDEFFAVAPTQAAGIDDGGLIAVGYTESFGAEAAGGMLLVKLAPNFENQGVRPEPAHQRAIVREFCSEARGVIQGDDGSFIVGGFADFSGNFCVQDEDLIDADAYLVKVDENLDVVIWERLYGGNGRSVARSVKATSDGGFLLGGDTDAFGPGSRAMLLIKTDGDGRVPPIVLQNIVDLAQNAGTEVEINTKDNFAIVQHDVISGEFSARELLFSAIGLPAGLNIDAATGVISGTLPSTPAEYHITVIAADDQGLSAATTFTLTAQ